MNKADLIDHIAGNAAITKVQANKIMDILTSTIVSELRKGKTFTLVGFGTFSVVHHAARNGRNPQTGETIKLKARKAPKFKPGAGFSAAILRT